MEFKEYQHIQKLGTSEVDGILMVNVTFLTRLTAQIVVCS